MALQDPTGGTGYLFGAVLPSADITTIATQQVRAPDFVDGSTHVLTGTVETTGAGLVKHANFEAAATTITGATTFASSVTLNGNPVTVANTVGVTVNGTVTMATDDARFRWRFNDTKLGDADEDVDCRADEYHLAASLTANRIYTLRHTGAFELPAGGERVRIRLNETPGAFLISVRREDATTLATMDGTAGIAAAEFIYTGSEWRTSMYSPSVINVSA